MVMIRVWDTMLVLWLVHPKYLWSKPKILEACIILYLPSLHGVLLESSIGPDRTQTNCSYWGGWPFDINVLCRIIEDILGPCA